MNLRAIRKSRGMTMKQVADLLGISEAAVSLYERGLRHPSIVTAAKIADIFGITVDELIGRAV